MVSEFAIVALIPEPFAGQIEALRKKYDRWSKSWLPPHITIIPPTQQLPERLIAATALCYPIEVSFGDWFSFRGSKGNVIWLDPGQTNPAQAQRQLLMAYPDLRPAVESRVRNGMFTFHVTIAAHIPPSEFSEALEQLQREHVLGRCSIEQLTLYRRVLPDGEWGVVE